MPPGAAAVAAVIEHEQIEVGVPVEIQVDEPGREVAGIAVQGEHHAHRIGQAQVQRRQARAVHHDGLLDDVRLRHAKVGGQLLGREQQQFLAPVGEPQHGSDGCRQQYEQEQDDIHARR